MPMPIFHQLRFQALSGEARACVLDPLELPSL